MTRKRTKLSKTHHMRYARRQARMKSGIGGVCDDQAFSCSSGRGDDDTRNATRYEAVAFPHELREVCELYYCNRVFRRQRSAGLLVGGTPLQGAETAIWLGTNTRP